MAESRPLPTEKLGVDACLFADFREGERGVTDNIRDAERSHEVQCLTLLAGFYKCITINGCWEPYEARQRCGADLP